MILSEQRRWAHGTGRGQLVGSLPRSSVPTDTLQNQGLQEQARPPETGTGWWKRTGTPLPNAQTTAVLVLRFIFIRADRRVSPGPPCAAPELLVGPVSPVMSALWVRCSTAAVGLGVGPLSSKGTIPMRLLTPLPLQL